ncbi:hypothetical protein Val02_20790 [Virgisporangium aliadipatigenens]|uniref:Mycothiol-dependent maleylpyruvate isomerase metal-binding domain-containing protein n=1 Tax=Virgisporangium aliadipatigenens TaxID=741659 RepID=A0A8J4DQ01_9ACTN|nr:maleylpyruvate isomerase N-terminal domain-containing protein [Virgisporangium aliadipatigenens]GIJ45193.1 hypothetical protein Val02_20790 [Virgisporangium aliadipatigenens]
MTFEERLATLDALWQAWAEHGAALTDDDWRRPTRLGTWDVRALYAHHGAWPSMLAHVVTQVRDAAPTHTAASLLRALNAPGGIAHSRRDAVASGAHEDAAAYTTAQALGQFTGVGPRAIEEARTRGPVTVDYLGIGLLRLDEAVSVGIMEATVHLLDLRRALDIEPDVPHAGLAHTAALLADVAPPVAFIEAATGRAPADFFPVLS